MLVLQSTEKSYTHPFNSGFFMLSTVKPFEMLPTHNEYGFILESFALNW